MPLFKCENCGGVENTALSMYWGRPVKDGKHTGPALCSACDPKMGNKWHKWFEQAPAGQYLLGNDGFLYSTEEFLNGGLDWRIKNQGFKILGQA